MNQPNPFGVEAHVTGEFQLPQDIIPIIDRDFRGLLSVKIYDSRQTYILGGVVGGQEHDLAAV
ncbi:hypothetical protein QFZ77_004452 [Paenibacillus sp. V4I3]|uniref:hypothetical protein n=1 Tax=Paenibacillus sp. V4I3 TaxID=3042305 RepID=UPI00278900BC|nr:hypothetical protein [Paenibacillus sp. V4I3]MDQ0875793.1 hypothetical protein [Paenibacillus sp. V4I3]